MKYQVLLLEDVINHGRKGDIVQVAPGFARNNLLPKGIACLASYATVRMQEKLQKERKEQAKKDKAASEALAASIKGKVLSKIVKVDHDGHMYGSVSVNEILELLFNEGMEFVKKQIVLPSPIKSLGNHQIQIKLPEEVMTSITIEVKSDRIVEKKVKETVKEESSLEENEKDASEDLSQ